MPEPVHWLERQWHRISPWHFLLWPLSLVFGAVVALRRLLYRTGLLPTFQAPVPVVVVGNVSVGGTGKTPLVRWLAQRLT
ncbi:MAG TPA: tetraacyldisaccharide 4'-kinase, partial [Burkholderiales bacterium]|nr:tetraacyldisaccharide 4'-kinase [Burkholderiales bacterium]